MSTYLRFQTNVLCPHAKRPLGIFRATGLLEDEGKIDSCFQETIDEAFGWYGIHLIVPRIPTEHRRCVFWFRTSCQHMVSKLWDIVAILEEHHIEVQRFMTSDPGLVVYRDECQVAAVPNRRIHKALRV